MPELFDNRSEPGPPGSRPEDQLGAAVLAEMAAAAAACDPEIACRHSKRAAELRDQLVELLKPRVRRLAEGFASSAKRAGMTVDDLVNEAGVKILAVIDRYDASRPLWPWLNRILHNRYLELIRKVLGTIEHPERVIDQQGGRSMDEDLFCLRVRRAVEGAMAGISPNDRRRDQKILAFQLYWLRCWTLQRIADHFRVSVGLVHGWIKELNAYFKAEFSAKYPEYLDPETGTYTGTGEARPPDPRRRGNDDAC